MTKFEIAFTKAAWNGIYSVNIVYANTAEQVAAHYEAKGYTVAGVTLASPFDKPSIPIYTLKDGE